MGCAISVHPDLDFDYSSSRVSTEIVTGENVFVALLEKYEKDTIIPETKDSMIVIDHYRLRAYLDSALGRAALRKYCPPEYTVLLDIWADVMGYRRDGVDRKMRHQLGVAICKKYVVSTEWMKHCIDGREVEAEVKVDKLSSKTSELDCKTSENVPDAGGLAVITRDDCIEHFGVDANSPKNHLCCSPAGCNFPLTAFDFLAKQIFMAIFDAIFHPCFVLGKRANAIEGDGKTECKSISVKHSFVSYEHSSPGMEGDEKNMTTAVQQLNELVLRSDEKITHKRDISVDSFAYGRVLGRGTFGLVASCIRKQPGMGTNKGGTGTVFAMKLQEKEEIIHRCDEDRNRAVMERKILSDCDCPYINKLYCAIQTNKLSLMVLEYAEFGDLSGFIRANGLKYLPLDRVRFYIAELTSAVVYLHSHGIMHRDIKPGNMLLKKNGHIILGDFGSAVCSLVGTISNDPRLSTGNGSRSRQQGRGVVNMLKGPSKMRAHSIVGTSQYMAPEVAYLATMPVDRRASLETCYSYTNAIDWWSVGVTAYKLLTGCRPIEDYQMGLILQHYDFSGGVDDLASQKSGSSSGGSGLSGSMVEENKMSEASGSRVGGKSRLKSLRTTPQRVSLNVDKIPDIAVQDFISELLDVNFITRLGSGAGGLEKVKKHDFFESVDWNLLDANQQDPPWVPDGEVLPAGVKPGVDLTGRIWTSMLSMNVGKWKKQSLNASFSTSSVEHFSNDFDPFLKSINKKHLRDSAEDDNLYSDRELLYYFSKWNYFSYECVLDDVGF